MQQSTCGREAAEDRGKHCEEDERSERPPTEPMGGDVRLNASIVRRTPTKRDDLLPSTAQKVRSPATLEPSDG